MKKNVKLILFGIALFLVACNGDETKTTETATDTSANKMAATDSSTTSQNMDALAVAPGLYTLAKDSAGLRVLNVNYKPGDSSAMHSHPDNVLYVVEGGKTQFTMQDGSKQVHELKAGDALIMPATTHSVKNIGTTTTQAILVEVNRPNTAGAAMDAAMDPVKVSPGQHKVIKDTTGIRAMFFTAKPGESTAKHSHPDHVIYVIESGKGEFTSADGAKMVKELPKGTVLINPATTHSFKNVGSTPIKVLVVEVNRPVK
jgi:quercetin dioxygenase-like cupin family protein